MSASPEFDSLLKQLERLLAEQARLGVSFSLRLVEERIRVERELIRMLQPGHDATEKRRSVRVPCELGGRLRTSLGPQQVAIVNIGCGGAGVEVDRAPALHDEVELEILLGPGAMGEMISRFGRIAWVSGRQAGVAFEQGTEPLDQHMLRFILGLLKNV